MRAVFVAMFHAHRGIDGGKMFPIRTLGGKLHGVKNIFIFQMDYLISLLGKLWTHLAKSRKV